MNSRYSQFHQWKIGTINITTGSDDWRLEEAVRQIHRSGLSICALQEVRRLRQDNVTITIDNQKYDVHWVGPKRIHEQGCSPRYSC